MADTAQQVPRGNGSRALPNNEIQEVPWLDENYKSGDLKAAGTYNEASVCQRTYNKYYNCSANNTTYKEDSGGVQVLAGLRDNGAGEENALPRFISAVLFYAVTLFFSATLSVNMNVRAYYRNSNGVTF